MMSGGILSITSKNELRAGVLSRPFALDAAPAALIPRKTASRRSKIWEFNANLHCSIIGTCLSVNELRHVLRKMGLVVGDQTDHALHGIGVSLAARHDDAAKQLNKALDQRHKVPIHRFAKADTGDGLRVLWLEAVRQGDIPGSYWAVLTHPLATQDLVREAFGDVHMLSHLVGSANRADIRRLCLLEAEKAALEERLRCQQQALHDAVVSRDRQINELRRVVTAQLVTRPADTDPADHGTLQALIADLQRRLTAETRRRVALDERVAGLRETLGQEQAARARAQADGDAMRRELCLLEASLRIDANSERTAFSLDGIVLLYVGARPNQIGPMRGVVERLGGTFLHHDGGIENHQSLLSGLTSRCDLVLFPVDCISHEAARAVKSLCRQSGKRYIPLRSASVTSLLAALRS